MSLKNEQILTILKQSAHPLSLSRIADIAVSQELLNTDYRPGDIEKLLRKLVDAGTVESLARGAALEYALPESDHQIVDERELDAPLVGWLKDRYGIQAQPIPDGPSGKKEVGARKWTYPDVVGYTNYREQFDPLLHKLAQVTGRGSVDLYSYELKKELTGGTVRNAILECAANSAWANYGYVVTARANDDALREFELFGTTQGVGLILLNVTRENDALTFLSDTKVLHECPRRSVDLRLIDRLCFEFGWEPFRAWLHGIAG